MVPSPFAWSSAEIFPGVNLNILLILFRFLTNANGPSQSILPFYTKKTALFYGNSHKKCTSLAAIARYNAISYKIDYMQIFQARYFFTKQIAMVFNKTTIMPLFYFAKLASIT